MNPPTVSFDVNALSVSGGNRSHSIPKEES